MEKEKEKKDECSRRDFLKKGATAAAGVAVAGTFLDGKPPLFVKNAFGAEAMRIVGMPLGNQPPINKKASEDLGFEIVGKTTSDQGLVLLVSTAPDEFDVAEEYINHLSVVWPAKTCQPIDTTRIKEWADTPPIFTSTGHIVKNELCDEWGIVGKGHAPRLWVYCDANGEIIHDPTKTSRWVTMVPHYSNADSLGYNAEFTAPIRSWADLWDPRFKGKAAMQGIPGNALVDVALALKRMGQKFEDIGELNRKEIDIIVDFIIEKKKEGHLRAIWETYDQSVSLMTSREVVIESMWGPAVNSARSAGVPCIYADLYSEGYRGFWGGFMISKNTKGKALDRAYDWINWALSGWYGAQVSRQGYYMFPAKNTKKFLTPEEYDYWYNGYAARTEIKDYWGGTVAQPGDVRHGGSYEQRMGRITCWNHFPKEMAYLTKRWNEMKAA